MAFKARLWRHSALSLALLALTSPAVWFDRTPINSNMNGRLGSRRILQNQLLPPNGRPLLAQSGHSGMTAFGGGFNRSAQHLLI